LLGARSFILIAGLSFFEGVMGVCGEGWSVSDRASEKGQRSNLQTSVGGSRSIGQFLRRIPLVEGQSCVGVNGQRPVSAKGARASVRVSSLPPLCRQQGVIPFNFVHLYAVSERRIEIT
jgi:hypothetical protein